MANVAEILKAITANREEFRNLFLQAQVGTGLERQGLESVTNEADDKKAFKAALEYAQVKGWLDNIVNILVDQGLEDGSLSKDISQNTNDPTLQAITNAIGGFTLPDIMYKGLANGMKWTGKLLVNQVPMGTGVLIGPNLFLTAWHVVKTLFRQLREQWVPDPDGYKSISVEFEDFLSLAGRRGGMESVFAAHETWCVSFSPCHTAELNSELPNNLSELEGFWDYAVIRLKNAPGLVRRSASLDPRAVVPKAQDKIVVFQHPAGHPMKIDYDDIAPYDPREVVPKLRFLHYANSASGSSGGPCFDKSFMFFGLHQGSWNTNGQRITNRGIPIARILDHIRETVQDLPGLDPSEYPIWQLPGAPFRPVLGLTDFQATVWRSVAGSKPKLIVIGGDNGKGKSFCAELMNTMLGNGGHLKIVLNAQEISKYGAGKIVASIASSAGLTLPPMRKLEEVNSTPSVWLKDELVAGLMSALGETRNGRLVWIFLTELNKFDIEGEYASEFLYMLYEQLLQNDWLRIVLDGMRGDIASTLEPVTEKIRVGEFSKKEIQQFINIAVAQLGLPMTPFSIEADVKAINKIYQDNLFSNSASAAKKIAESISQKMTTYIEILSSANNGNGE